MEPTGLEGSTTGSTTSYGNGNPLKWSAYFEKKKNILVSRVLFAGCMKGSRVVFDCYSGYKIWKQLLNVSLKYSSLYKKKK